MQTGKEKSDLELFASSGLPRKQIRTSCARLRARCARSSSSLLLASACFLNKTNGFASSFSSCFVHGPQLGGSSIRRCAERFLAQFCVFAHFFFVFFVPRFQGECGIK